MKSNNLLKNKIEELGIDLTKHLITSCGSGVTASILYVVLKGLGAERFQFMMDRGANGENSIKKFFHFFI